MIRVSLRTFRGALSLRFRGRDDHTGNEIDTTQPIDFAAPAFSHIDRSATGVRAKRALDAAIADHARDMQRRINMPPAVLVSPEVRDEMSFAELWALYARRVRGLKPETLDRSRKNVAPLIAYFDHAIVTPDGSMRPPLKPSQVTLGQAEEFIAWRLQQKAGRSQRLVSERTAANEAGALRALIEWGFERCDETGIMGVKLTKTPSGLNRKGSPKAALTVPQFFALLDACAAMKPAKNDPRHLAPSVLRSIVIVGVTTRARRTPLLGFRREWVDERDRWLSIPAEIQKGDNALSIPVAKWTTDELSVYPAAGLAWPSHSGQSLSWIEYSFAKLKETANELLPRDQQITQLSPHTLRRSGNSIMFNHRCERHTAPISDVVLEILLGHSLGPMIAAYYRSDPGILREAVSIYDELRAEYESTRNVRAFRLRA